MRKVVVLLTVLAMLVMALGPVSAGAAPKKVEVTFWHAMGAQLGDTLNSLVNQFNSSQDEVFVKAEYQGNYNALSQKIIGALVARKPPTIAQVYGNWAAEYIASDALVPMEQFINGPDGLTQKDKDDIWAGLWAATKFNGTIYTIPFNKSVYVMVYNKDAFKEAGITSVPKTWQELVQAAIKLTKKGPDGKIERYGIALRPNVDIYSCFFFSNGGQWLKPDGKTLAVTSSAGVEALQFMTDLLHKYKVAYYIPGYIDQDFAAGKCAIYFTTSPGLSYVEKSVAGKFQWAVAPLPYKSKELQATPLAGTDIAMFKQASQAEREAAWKFIKWLIKPENVAKWAIETSYIPIRKSALALMGDYFLKYPHMRQSVEQLPYIKYDPNLSSWYDARGKLSEAVETAFLQKASPKEALEAAAKECDKLIAKELGK